MYDVNMREERREKAYLLENTRVLGCKAVRALDGRPEVTVRVFAGNEAGEASVPHEVSELLESRLVPRVELEFRFGLNEESVLESSLSEHHARVDMWVVVYDLLCEHSLCQGMQRHSQAKPHQGEGDSSEQGSIERELSQGGDGLQPERASRMHTFSPLDRTI